MIKEISLGSFLAVCGILLITNQLGSDFGFPFGLLCLFLLLLQTLL